MGRERQYREPLIGGKIRTLTLVLVDILQDTRILTLAIGLHYLSGVEARLRSMKGLIQI